MKKAPSLPRIIIGFFALILLATSLVTLTPQPSYANDACELAGIDDPRLCGEKDKNEEAALQERVKNVLNQIYLWVGIMAVVAIIIGGITYMTSMGDSNKIRTAKSTIMYSLIGLVVTLMAFAITNLILDSIDGKQPTAGQSSGGGSGGNGGNGSQSENIPVKSVVLGGVSTLKIGQNAAMRATVIPDYATNRQLTWKTSDKNVVTVDNKGRVVGVSPGSATITVTADDKSDSKTITVPVPILATALTFDSANYTVAPKGTKNIIPRFTPANTDDKTLKWASTNSSIVTVDDNGRITGIKEGTTTVYATTTNNITATAKVTVSNNANAKVSGKYCTAETGRGLCKATNITFRHNVKDSNGRCGTINGSYCKTLATVTYPKGTIEYYIGYQNNPGLNKGSCRAHAFMAAHNATSGTFYSTIDIQNNLKKKGLYNGTLRAKDGYAETIKHFNAKAKAYFGETSVKESKRLAKIALDNGQPVAMFVAHSQCPKLAGSHHALLLLGYDSKNNVQFIDSSGYSISQSGKYTLDKLFDTCMSGKGVRDSWMGMQIFQF